MRSLTSSLPWTEITVWLPCPIPHHHYSLSSLSCTVLYVQNATGASLTTQPRSARPEIHPATARQQGASQGDAIWGVLWAQVIRGDQRPVLWSARRVRCGVRAVCQILDELLEGDFPARQELKRMRYEPCFVQWLGLRGMDSWIGEDRTESGGRSTVLCSTGSLHRPLHTNARRLLYRRDAEPHGCTVPCMVARGSQFMRNVGWNRPKNTLPICY